MKNQYFLLFLSFFILASCSKPKPPSHKADWQLYTKAYNLLVQGKDSAYFYFNKVTSTTKDSLPVATAYYNMAVIQSDAGDYFGAQESLTLSLRNLNENRAENRLCLAEDYNELGRNHAKQKNYTAAINDYDRALHFTADDAFVKIILNNKAQAYQENKDYLNALKIYEGIINGNKIKDVDYARTLTNITITKWLLNPAYNPVPQLLIALQIRQRAGDLWGENSSYDHLADYYMHNEPDSSLFYSRVMYTAAIRLNSPDDQLQALEKIIKTAPAAETRKYFTLYQSLNDSVQTARSAAKNQFALIRYNVEKNKTDNLLLQKDNADKNYQLNQQRIITGFITVISVMAIIATIYWLRKRKQQAVSENQLRLSAKVHNRVANGLYQLIQEIDNNRVYDKEYTVRQLNVFYNRSRDISHEELEETEKDFAEQIRRLLEVYAGADTNVAIVGNNQEFWLNVPEAIKNELEQMLQEWMINMKRHSQATSVSLRFERIDRRIIIYYADNGKGFTEPIKYGRGLKDTENRIEKIGGKITFANGAPKGVRIQLTLPMA